MGCGLALLGERIWDKHGSIGGMGLGQAWRGDNGRGRLASEDVVGTSLAVKLGWKSLARGHGVGTSLVRVQGLGQAWLGHTGMENLAKGQGLEQAWLGDKIWDKPG